MSVLSVRNVLPLATAIVSTLFLATAVPHDLVPEPALALAASPAFAQAEVQRCAAEGRDVDACQDEADAKALIERAEWQARGDAAYRRASR